MKVSIAMATYNGAKYLEEQLDSFKRQTRLPDELIICDDCSTDNTVQILDDFSRKASFTVKIYRNSERLGFIKNFSRAISLCSGDFIFLSDQDDLWLPQKIQRIEQEFLLNPAVAIVVNDAEIADQKLIPSGLTVAGQLISSGQKLDELDLGCCIAFKSLLVPVIVPVPEFQVGPNKWVGHDTWLNRIGNDFQCRSLVLDVLQYYRRHNSNVTVGMDNVMMTIHRVSRWQGIKRRYSRKDIQTDPASACEKRLALLRPYRDRILADAEYFKKYLEPIGLRAVSNVLSSLDEQIHMNEKRMHILQRGLVMRLFLVLHFYSVGGYKFFQGWKSALKDMLYLQRRKSV